MIKVIYRNDYSAFYKKSEISIPYPDNDTRLQGIEHIAAVLHELGHIHYKHVTTIHDSLDDKISQELEAWDFALRCIKPGYHHTLRDLFVENFGSYVRASMLGADAWKLTTELCWNNLNFCYEKGGVHA